MMSSMVTPSSAKLGEDLHELLSVFYFSDWKLKDKPSTWAMPSDSRAPKQPSDPHLGVSENSVPLNPVWLMIIIPFLTGYFIGNINPTFSDKPI